ncbi:hypothetical protein GCM10007301_51720 [Azorhizobium oxalatiphilum]|uniref:Lipopolysaccharide assembly protein A domain-containing protein n=1 Tax=Azorhizobium oxalatiphilum TaxID=980631 RepID=A0A917FJ51_9HYPH|nr:LapA family protein [Azorhizobium oxalatiphilum]GGF85486.1 hypothetical protein GCM10007301_51720 [Azorhizobium oxalatiphilum]
MGRILSVLIGLPVSILLVALAVANRRPVTLSLDPFSPDSPALSVTVPLFSIVFGGVILGLIIGGLYTWLRQGRHRKQARQAKRDLNRLKAANEAAPTVTGPLPGSALALGSSSRGASLPARR